MIEVRRLQVLAYRLQVNNLTGDRLPPGSLAVAAHGGLQDGSPRSALLSLAARVEGVGSDDWRADSLAQVFGPRGAIYVVPATDVALFTLGLLPRDPERVAGLEATAARVHAVLAGKSKRQADVIAALPDIGGTRGLRRAATLGTLVPAWDGVDTIVCPASPPPLGRAQARLELARRFFKYLGPATVADLQWWLDGLRGDAAATVAALGDELVTINAGGKDCLASSDALPHLAGEPEPEEVLLLPPDDLYINRLTRPLLVPDPQRQQLLWPQAPPPGALIVGGEVEGTWRRRGGTVEVTPWNASALRHRERTEEIVAAWPLETEGKVTWLDPA